MKLPFPAIRQLIMPVIAVLVAILVVLVMIGWLSVGDLTKPNQAIGKVVEKIKQLGSSDNSILTSQSDNYEGKFVAVYLENGRVYFGKLEKANATEPALTDVYYLSVASSEDAAKTGEFQLIKFTDQFQAPTDRLEITRDSILFWEPLRDDSRVIEAVNKYKEQK